MQDWLKEWILMLWKKKKEEETVLVAKNTICRKPFIGISRLCDEKCVRFKNGIQNLIFPFNVRK